MYTCCVAQEVSILTGKVLKFLKRPTNTLEYMSVILFIT